MDMDKNVVGVLFDYKDIKCEMKYIVWWIYMYIFEDILNYY